MAFRLFLFDVPRMKDWQIEIHSMQTCLLWEGDNIELSTQQNLLTRRSTVCCQSWPEPEYLSPQKQGHLLRDLTPALVCRLLSLQISLGLRCHSWEVESLQPMYSWKFTHCHPKSHKQFGLLSTRFSMGIIPQGQPQDFYRLLKEEGWYCELCRDSCEDKATPSLLSSFRYKFLPLLSCFLSVVTKKTTLADVLISILITIGQSGHSAVPLYLHQYRKEYETAS